MTLTQLIGQYNYKSIFNFIFSYYCNNAEYKDIVSLDISMYAYWQSLKNTEPKDTLPHNFIYLSEFTDDLDENSESNIDVCLFDSEKDEHSTLDFVEWEKVLDLPIRKSCDISDKESLAHIFWEITFWKDNGRELMLYNQAQNKENSDWEQVEKDLGDLYN